MSQAAVPLAQEASGTRRAPKRQRRRSGGPSPGDAVTQQQVAPDIQTGLAPLCPGVRTRSSVAVGHEQQQQEPQVQHQQQQHLRVQRRSARRLRQLHQRQPPGGPSGACERPEPTTSRGGSPSRDPVTGMRQQPARAPREGGAPAGDPTRQRRRRRAPRGSCGCGRPARPVLNLLGAVRPSSALLSFGGALGDSAVPTGAAGPDPPSYARAWALEEERGRTLLHLLNRARSFLLEPLLDIPALRHVVLRPSSDGWPTGPPGSPQASEEPIVCLRGPNGALSSLRIFSGAACLSQQHVAALSHEAAGRSPMGCPRIRTPCDRLSSCRQLYGMRLNGRQR